MVRLSIAVAILALSAHMPVHAAPSAMPDLAKGEMLLTVTGRGVVKQQPSRISSICTLREDAETEAAARERLAAKTKQLKANVPNGSSFDFSEPIGITDSYPVGAAKAAAEAVVAADAAVPGEAVAEPATDPDEKYADNYYRVSQEIDFSATNADAFLKARTAIDEAGCDENYRTRRNPKLEISDPAAAKKSAMQDALADAKKKAEDYAAALNMQVKFMVAVEDSNEIRAFIGDEIADAFLSEMMRDFNRDRNQGDQVQLVFNTSHILSVQYLLTPK